MSKHRLRRIGAVLVAVSFFVAVPLANATPAQASLLLVGDLAKIEPELRARIATDDGWPALDRGHEALGGEHGGQEVALGHDDAVAGVGELVRDLLRRGGVVDRERRRAEVQDGRRQSPAHFMRWYNLVGFCLRPGFGDPLDRFGQIPR